MKPILKYILTITVSLLIILIFSNPSFTKFKQYSNEIPLKNTYIIYRKTFNGFFFSLYTKEVAHTWGNNKIGYIESINYLGILSNFTFLSSTKTTPLNAQVSNQ